MIILYWSPRPDHYYHIYLWKSTFLFSKQSNHKSKLIYAENIPITPVFLDLNPGQTLFFTLVFLGLPNNCKSFDFVEQLPIADFKGFSVSNIKRNKKDVYNIVLKSASINRLQRLIDN